MVKVFKGTDKEYYMDGYLKDNLDVAIKVVADDWDMVFAIDGYEGTGKSVFTQQCATYCDPTFNLSRIVFTPEQFMEAVRNAKKFQAIIYDEAYGGLSSKTALKTFNRAVVKMLTEIRQKNLFIFIVLPTFFDLVKYVALWRSRALIHIYSGDEFKRGFFAFYNVDKKKQLFVHGKKFYSYSKPKPNFTGRFVNHYTVDVEAYKKKKIESTVEEKEDLRVSVINITREIKQSIALNLLEAKLGLTQQQIADVMGVTTMTVYNYRKKYEKVTENRVIS